ncbi:nitrile hydratase accessory protein [Zavarzinia sp. CC-PAN008]|uniref:nitrile hydratase accessory protein n=1 Tax=Zavarzinia sp. CC-PAN008 TaxID=3243332 RepID=UPI003F747102
MTDGHDDLAVLPAERVFAEPWEARIFAIVVALSRQGRFPWVDFHTRLAAEIAAEPDQAYYESWLHAAEDLLASLALLSHAETDAEVARLRPDDRTIRLR